MTTYLVYSPGWIEGGYGYEAPEPTADACEIDAPTRRDAIRQAVKHPDMQRWVSMARGDGCNPFAGLKADPMTGDVEDVAPEIAP